MHHEQILLPDPTYYQMEDIYPQSEILQTLKPKQSSVPPQHAQAAQRTMPHGQPKQSASSS
jgi:hypothetical protein